MLSHRARLRTIAGIESNLAATCLRVIETDFDAQSPQGSDHCFADIGKHLVDQAGNEKRDAHLKCPTNFSLSISLDGLFVDAANDKLKFVGHSDYRVPQRAQPFDLNFIDVAGFQQDGRITKDAYAFGGAGRDYVPRFQS